MKNMIHKIFLILFLIGSFTQFSYTAEFGGDADTSSNINIVQGTQAQNISGSTTLSDTITGLFFNILNKYSDKMYLATQNIMGSSLLASLVTILIMIYAVKKISQADFEVPKDAIQIVMFIALVWVIKSIATNQAAYQTLLSILDIPANYVSRVINELMSSSNVVNPAPIGDRGNTISGAIQTMYDNAFYLIQNSISFSDALPWNGGMLKIIGKALLGIINIVFTTLLIIVILAVNILTTIQIALWKGIALFVIPLAFFPQTRGFFFMWAKTIITLTLIGASLFFSAYFSVSVEETFFTNLNATSTETDETIGFGAIAIIILGKAIAILLIKEIPNLINSLMGTNAGTGAGFLASAGLAAAMGGMGAAAMKGLKGLSGGGGMATGAANAAKLGANLTGVPSLIKAGGDALGKSSGNIGKVGNTISKGVENLTKMSKPKSYSPPNPKK